MTAAWRRLHDALSAILGQIPSLAHHSPSRVTRVSRGEGLALVYAPMLLAIIATGLLAQHNANVLTTSQAMVSHTYVVQRQVRTVETQLIDTENALRGYLLVGDARSLAHYVADRPALMAAITRLHVLLAGDAATQRRVTSIATVVETLLTAWQQAIDLRAQHRMETAIEATRTSRVQQMVASIHALLDELDASEARALVAQLRATNTRAANAQVSLLVATSVDVALLVALVLCVRHTISVHKRFVRAESAARTAAEEAVALRDEFLSLASHELRTPIAVLVLNMQLLERSLSIDGREREERIQQILVVVRRQLRRIQSLIATMLDVSRIEGGRLTMDREAVDLVALARMTIEDLQATPQTPPIDLDLPAEASFVLDLCGDATRLEQVMHNLLQNAIKYSSQGSPITVKLAREADWAILTVTDYGIGIAEDALPHVFEQFYRAPEVRSEHISGMGIGLYLVHEIVALHGGVMSITSEQGVGTRVTVHLPLVTQQTVNNEGTCAE